MAGRVHEAEVSGSKRLLYADAPQPSDEIPAYFRGYFDSIPSSLLLAADLVPPEAANVLDVGCALGKFGRLLKSRRDIEVVGVELMAEAAAVAADHLDDVLILDLDETPDLGYPENSFDVLTMLDVVEHLVLPEQVIIHLARWVRVGGSLIFSVPNIRHLSVITSLLGPRRRFGGTAPTVDHHLRFFTITDLLAMLDRLGLSVCDSIFGVGSDEHPAQGPIAEAVEALGGDRQRALFDSRVAQWVIHARRAEPGQTVTNLTRDLSVEWRPNLLTPVAQLGLAWAESVAPAGLA